ncbi:MAG: glycosyltransferase, partial [Gemmatimonadaceae bacterium]
MSVCISAYNVERFLAEALQSVLDQTYRELEIIVLDNGSVDGTFAVAQSFQDARLRCHRVPDNLGAYQAMNRLAAMATGAYVAIYHSDDVYEPTIVEREVAHLTAHPEVASVFCTDHFMDEHGHIYGGASLAPELSGRASLGYEDVIKYFVRRKNTLFCCPTFMMRRG